MKKRILISLLASVVAVAITAPTTSAFAEVTNPVKVTSTPQYVAMDSQNMYYFLLSEKVKFPNGTYWAGGNPDSYITVPCSNHSNDNKYKPDQRLKASINYNLGQVFGYYASDIMPYGSYGSYDQSGSSTQCYGFAEKLQSDYFGTDSSVQVGLKRVGNEIQYMDGTKYEPRIGDHLRFNDGVAGHSIFITSVNGNRIIYADCNSDGHCIIKWNQTAYLDNLNVNGHKRIDFVGRPMMVGDVTGDTIIDQADVTELGKMIVGNPTVAKCNLNYRSVACDIDGSGKVDSYDLLLLTRALNNNTTDYYGYLYQ
ncbi:MAG: dockerin type I domain-containing protein [Oscillospiraceae bacterium]|nr:dockerin type I domain-containing protein [Oscillospiraceae bacterium]